MPETPTFPLPPIDAKFQARLERSRDYVPPETVSLPDCPRPDFRGEASRALRRYMRRDREPIVLETGPSLLEQLPERAVSPLCTGVAVGLLVVELLYFVTCRPDVHPRLARRNVLSPVDVKKSLVVSRDLRTAARTLIRTFVRRT